MDQRKGGMGLVGVHENGNGEMGLSGIPLGSKNKYRRMDSELTEEDERRHLSHNTRKYVIACAIFASLNSVLLGYGKHFSPFSTLFIQPFSVLSNSWVRRGLIFFFW